MVIKPPAHERLAIQRMIKVGNKGSRAGEHRLLWKSADHNDSCGCRANSRGRRHALNKGLLVLSVENKV